MFQPSAFQNNAFQMLIVVLATVLVFRSLMTTTKLEPVLTTTVVTEFLGPQALFYEDGRAAYYEDGGAVYGKVL